MLNSWTLNSQSLNSIGSSKDPFIDWTLFAPAERQAVYMLDVGELRLPITSAQATMRRTGQSFLQAVVPNAGAYAGELAALTNNPMILSSGYRYEDGSLSPLEPIAQAPFQLSSRATGPVNDTLTLSGYAQRPAGSGLSRPLREIQTRTTGQDGRRRVRCGLDLFLRPGHLALDSDGTGFTVGVIQYFINATSEAMEVIEDG
jgi:hypothetical protein